MGEKYCVIDGVTELKSRKVVKKVVQIPTSRVVWLEAPESTTEMMTMGEVTTMLLIELTRDCWSQVLDHNDKGGVRPTVKVPHDKVSSTHEEDGGRDGNQAAPRPRSEACPPCPSSYSSSH
jgi:hypothetical protein